MTWQETEADIIALLRQSSALQTELKNCQEKAANEKQQMLLHLARVLDAFDRVFDNIGPKRERRRQADQDLARKFPQHSPCGGLDSKRGRRAKNRIPHGQGNSRIP